MAHAASHTHQAFVHPRTNKARVKTYDVTVSYEAPHKKPDVIEVPYASSAKEAEKGIIDRISVKWERGKCLWGKFTVKAKLRSVRYV